MTRSSIITVLIASLLAPGIHGATPASTNSPAPSASASPPPSGLTLDAFRLIAERNIFNPNRSGRAPEREFTRREPERRVRTESISLVGTISYDKGDFAFFDGSSSSYHRAVKSSETIADLTVTSITPTQVILRSGSGSSSNSSTNASDTNTVLTLTLPVGMQLRRQDNGPWELAARTETVPSASSSAATLPAGSEDVLKRLMQQREKEGGSDSSAASTPPAPEATPAQAAPATPPSPETSPAPGSGGPENDILKRLMQRREKGE